MKKPIIRDENSRYTSDRRYSVGLDNPEASWSQEKFDAMFCDFYDAADDAPEMQLITVILFIPEGAGSTSSYSESGIFDSSSVVEALPC